MKNRLAAFPNILTVSRIFGAVGLLFLPPLSSGYYALYFLCGLTDLVDGPLARALGTASSFGARLDTSADVVFVTSVLWTLLRHLSLPVPILLWIALIALVKVCTILMGLKRDGRIPVEHTRLNKLTGLLLFLFPLTISHIPIAYSACLVAAVASLAVLEEAWLVYKGKTIE